MTYAFVFLERRFKRKVLIHQTKVINRISKMTGRISKKRPENLLHTFKSKCMHIHVSDPSRLRLFIWRNPMPPFNWNGNSLRSDGDLNRLTLESLLFQKEILDREIAHIKWLNQSSWRRELEWTWGCVMFYVSLAASTRLRSRQRNRPGAGLRSEMACSIFPEEAS